MMLIYVECDMEFCKHYNNRFCDNVNLRINANNPYPETGEDPECMCMCYEEQEGAEDGN